MADSIITSVAGFFTSTRKGSANSAATRRKVMTLAQKLADSFLRGDFASYVDMLYPVMVEKNGGKQHYIAAIKEAVSEAKTQGHRITSIHIGEPHEILEGENTLQCLVPQAMVRDNTETIDGFLLAISDVKSNQWHFFDITGANKEEVTSVIPVFHADHKLPS